jgi:predicted helicase
MVSCDNIALIVGRFGAATGDEEWNIVFVSRQVVDLNIFRRGGGEVHPLYLYSEAEAQGGLWSGGRRVNLSEGFLEALEQALTPLAPLSHEERGDERPSPSGRGVGGEGESILAYIYALLHAPSYRARYAEFLRRDFPRIPLPPNREAFERLAALGQELIALHLLEHPDLHIPLCKFPVAGENKVERVRYEQGRVWMNERQYFEPVPSEAWAFRVGGYPVCEKWLADRKGRVLSFDEILTYQRIVSALARTVEVQGQVDGVCAEVWGW